MISEFATTDEHRPQMNTDWHRCFCRNRPKISQNLCGSVRICGWIGKKGETPV